MNTIPWHRTPPLHCDYEEVRGREHVVVQSDDPKHHSSNKVIINVFGGHESAREVSRGEFEGIGAIARVGARVPQIHLRNILEFRPFSFVGSPDVSEEERVCCIKAGYK